MRKRSRSAKDEARSSVPARRKQEQRNRHHRPGQPIPRLFHIPKSANNRTGTLKVSETKTVLSGEGHSRVLCPKTICCEGFPTVQEPPVNNSRNGLEQTTTNFRIPKPLSSRGVGNILAHREKKRSPRVKGRFPVHSRFLSTNGLLRGVRRR